jgi:hypothetical protein
MAKIKQFTITVENRPGAVAEIAKALGKAKVNVLSLLGTAQRTSGAIHLLTADARRARKALDEAKIQYQETVAEEYELPNKAGALAQCLENLAAKGVNLSSIHATVSKGGRKAVMVYMVEAEVKAVQACRGIAIVMGRATARSWGFVFVRLRGHQSREGPSLNLNRHNLLGALGHRPANVVART